MKILTSFKLIFVILGLKITIGTDLFTIDDKSS